MFTRRMLTAGDLMTSDPDVVAPQTSIKEAIVLMNRGKERHLPVVQDGKLIGMVTDRDIRLAVNSPLIDVKPVERLHFMEDIPVERCMTANPQTVTVDTPIYQVAGLLARYKFGAVPVLDGDDLVGIISVIDLLEFLALEPETA